MKQRWLLGALAGALIVLWAAEAAQAQVFVGRGGGRGGRGGTSVGVYTPGFSFQYGNPGYGYGYGRGFNPYYGGWNSGYGYGAGYGMYPRYGYNVYPNYGYGVYSSPRYYSTPSWGTYSYPYTGYTYSNSDQIWNTNSSPYAQGTSSQTYRSFYPEEQGNQAHVRVLLPDPRARVWIENAPTQQQGREREFVSPPLEAGHKYTYTIRASWMENGREMSQQKTVSIQPGQESLVNFMEPADRSTTSRQPNGTNEQGGTTTSRQPTGTNEQGSPTNADKLIVPVKQRVEPGAETHEGKIVRAGDGKITMTDMQGNNQHTHDVPTSAKIMRDGKEANLTDLREGDRVSVTTKDDASKTVVRVEVKTENK